MEFLKCDSAYVTGLRLINCSSKSVLIRRITDIILHTAINYFLSNFVKADQIKKYSKSNLN